MWTSSQAIWGKRLELLCAAVPSIRVSGSEAVEQQRQAVATTDAEIEAGFAALVKLGIAALVVQNDPFFDSRRSQILALSSRH
jgi:putative ABC transport system substrate-binding protein